MKAIIHVNRAMIAANTKDGGDRPVYTIKRGRSTVYGHGITIKGGTVELIDPRSTKPLKCGARAYLRVSGGEIAVTDPMSFAEAKSPGH